MKKVLFPILALVLALGLALPMATGASPGPGIVGLWHLDEGSGNITADSSGNGNDGTLLPTGLEPTWVSGMFGNALSFDGTDDYLQVPSSSSLNPATITVEAWFKATDITGQTYPPIVKKADANAGYALEIYHGDSKLRFWVYIDSVGWKSSPASGAISLDTWYHAVGTYDGSYVRLYINGSEVTSGTAQSGTIKAATNPLNIGRDPSNTSRLFNGTIDEVRIWDEARTAAQIAQDYRDPVVTTSLSGPSSVPVGTVQTWNITIKIYGGPVAVNSVMVQDGMGADLFVTAVNGFSYPHSLPMPKKVSYYMGSGVTLAKRGGRMGATMVIWNVGNLAAGGSDQIVVTVQTGKNNPGSPRQAPKQEFTSPDPEHELDGGASATYWWHDGSQWIEYETMETVPLTVEVTE